MNEGIVLSPQGLKRLQEELGHLTGERRAEIAERIQQARDYGDLSENAEYHDAKEEQAFVEGRIAEIEHILKHATVVEGHAANEVGIGSRVTVAEGGADTLYQIVGATEADPASGKISIDSPLGTALLGKAAGDQILLETPGGTRSLIIKAIE